MTRSSGTGGKTNAAKTPKARSAKDRNSAKAKPGISTASRSGHSSASTDLRKQLKEAREHQAATADILKVIASSASDVQPVFDAIAHRANRLVGGFSTAVYRVIDDVVHMVAFTPTNPEADEALRAAFPMPRSEVPALALVQNGETAQIADSETADEQTRRLGRARGWRSVTFTPLMNRGKFIGFIVCTRQKKGVLGEHHVQLLRTFADQAVIAIENARLFNEVKAKTLDLEESLQQQTATADVLKVISRSTFDLQPVLDTLVETAARLCETRFAFIVRRDGDLSRVVAATHGVSAKYVQWLSANPAAMTRASAGARAVMDKKTVHIHDVLADPDYQAAEHQSRGGYRTVLGVPLLRGDEAIGAFSLAHTVVKPFTEKQIELVTTFADQAVIAIENIRLFNETKEALAHQTATSEVLQAIGNSMADTQPVFERILDSVERLFEIRQCAVMLAAGDGMLHLAARRGIGVEAMDRFYPVPLAQTMAGDVVETGQQIYVASAASALASPLMRRVAETAGDFSVVLTPMLWEGRGIGVINLSRAPNATFSEKELALLRTFADQAVIAIQNARLFNETKEALERQTATADILKVIASSPADVQPVFEAVAASANRLIGGLSTAVLRFVEGNVHLASFTPVSPEADAILRSSFPGPITAFEPFEAASQGKLVQIEDAEAGEDSPARQVARARGYRSLLLAPLMNAGRAIGLIGVTRITPGAFSPHHVQLLQTFADQAVIAIENARLFNEVQAKTRYLEESLQQQTATADVLKVISRSTFDLQTVLNTLVESATHLCEADHAWLFQCEGDSLLFKSSFGHDTEVHRRLRDLFLSRGSPINRGSIVGRSVLEARVVHVADVLADPEYTRKDAQKIGGYRAALGAPLLRDGQVIGVIFIAKARPEPFSEKQVELVTTFADQAVIAIENVRLFEEVQARTRDLQESLQQQTATSEVLEVISSSPGDLQPVFKSMLNNALRICEAKFGHLLLFDGKGFVAAELHDTPAEYADLFRRGPLVPASDTALGRLVASKEVIHIPDVMAGSLYAEREPLRIATVDILQARTLLAVPLLKETELVGAIVIYRQEVRPFSERQVNLVTTFADQAVIAIENARLFNETQEALQRQTATSDVLRVIGSSPGDLQPVFDAVLENATRICAAQCGILYRCSGDALRTVATHGAPRAFVEERTRNPIVSPNPDTTLGRALSTKQPVQIADILAEIKDSDDRAGELPKLAGARTVLAVPMVKASELMGAILIYRQEVRPFTDKQIELVVNFAAQSVIAIENTRLLNELRESLQQQTATSEVLQVISSSPGDLAPVFDKMLENATRVCGAEFGSMVLVEGDTYRNVAMFNAPPVFVKARAGVVTKVHPKSSIGAAIRTRQVVQVEDLRNSPGYFERVPPMVQLAELGGARTIVVVPMLLEDKVIGLITVYRQEVRLFGEKQIDLLTNFARQAVIAIENARLLKELRHRTDDLTEALVYQTGSSNILKVIASSPTDVGPALQAIVESACEICDANDAVALMKDGDDLRISAHHGTMPVSFEGWRISRQWVTGRAAVDKVTLQVADLLGPEGDEFTESKEILRKEGYRTVLSVPLLQEGEAIGVICLRRTEVQPFNEKQIELLKSFADQAVIAISNVKLFEQVQQRTRDLTESLQQQTATSEVLQIISSSPGDLSPVFNKMLENATRICGANFGTMLLCEDGGFRTVALYHAPKAYTDTQLYRVFYPHPESGLSAIKKTRVPIHIADLRAEPPYVDGNAHVRALADLGGARTLVIVPMLKESDLVGAITIYRKEVKPFTDKQTDLVSNFAKQAVIAIENTRLLNELRDRTAELSRSLDDLRAAQDRLVQTEKLASLGQLTAGIAHEIKNPLNFVNNFSALSVELTEELKDLLNQAALAEQLRKEVDELTGLLKDNLSKIVQHGKRADSIVKNMLLHSREGSGELRAADVNALVEESLNLAYHGARAEKAGFNISLQREFDASAGSAELFPQEITRALLNLISNGFYAATKRKSENDEAGFEPTLSATTRNLGASVEIRIRDNGTGVPPEVKEKMFNPFFTTKPAGEGTGLGLSMTHDIIVKQHGGTIHVHTEPGAFTEFIVTLPRASGVQSIQRST